MHPFYSRGFAAPISLAMAFVLVVPDIAQAAPGINAIAREAVELALRLSRREVTERASREVAEKAVEKGIAKYGPRAAEAVADGGMELLEASARYGDDVMRVAVEASPAARRALALQPGRMLPLVREFGEEAIELEAKSPGLARRMFSSFGNDGARQIARQVPADDMPRLLAYLRTIDVDKLGLSNLPFVEKSLGSLLDVASVFKQQVVDKIDFNRPLQMWEPAKGQSASATGSLPSGAAVQAGSVQLRGAPGQFAASMAGYWITVTGTPSSGDTRPVSSVAQIVSVSADGSALTLSRNFTQDLNEIGRAHV